MEKKLFVQLSAKVYKTVNVYPELLLEQKDKLHNFNSNYCFSVYYKNHLVEQYGTLVYKNIFISALKPDSCVTFFENGVEHFLYQYSNDVHVVISSLHNPINIFITATAYQFLLMLLLIFLIWFVIAVTRFFQNRKTLKLFEQTSFRSIIQFSLILFIIMSAVFTSIFTGKFFIQRYNQFNNQKLIDKLTQNAKDNSNS